MTIATQTAQPLWRLLLPWTVAGTLYRHRDLIRQLTWREVAGRYRGSALGILWSLLLPLAMLAVYTFVFSVVFQARFETQISDSRAEFALTLFCGLLLFGLFSECLSTAPNLIAHNANYVKKVVFPLEVLVVVRLGAALVHALISLGILLIGAVVFLHTWSTTLVWYPLVVLPLLMLTLGLGWFLASIGVYVRDAAQVVGVVLNVLIFLTPIFYPVQAVPPAYRGLMWLNPLTVVVESARQTALRSAAPDWAALGVVALVSLAAMQLGFTWFMKTKRGFADVL